MLSWSKHAGGSTTVRSYSASTILGTAVIHELTDGRAALDMWKPDQSNIGKGTFASVELAKRRAETILDPRSTFWDMLDHPELAEAG